MNNNNPDNNLVYDTSFQTVDVIVVDKVRNCILFGKKKSEVGYCMVGGFVDPKKDKTLEEAARRELIEETGINMETSFPKYLGSFRVDDQRYRASRHKIMTAVFVVEYIFGAPKAGDDLDEVKWYRFQDINKRMLTVKHYPVIKMLIEAEII